MLSIIGEAGASLVWLGAAHEVVQIIADAVYSKVRTRFGFRITRTSIFNTLPTSRRMLVSAGAVAPQYELAAIIYNDAITAIIVSLKVSTTEL